MALNTTHHQIGISNTASQNFTFSSFNNGTMKLARGNIGATTQDIMTVDSSGVAAFPQGAQVMVLMASKNATGTSVDFYPADGTGIPSWAKKVIVLLDSVSTNGTSVPLIQIGAGSIDTSAYLGSTSILTTATSTLQTTQGFPLIQSLTAAWVFSSVVELVQLSSGLWLVRGAGAVISGSTASMVYGGRKLLSGTLDRIRITTVNGTDAFDAGTISLLIEG